MGRERRQDSSGARLRGLPMGLSLSLALRKYLAFYPGSTHVCPYLHTHGLTPQAQTCPVRTEMVKIHQGSMKTM